MAACFQVILTWSSLTTAKLFPLFSPPSLPPSFFRSGLLKDRERAQTKTMAGSYGAFRSKSGQVFKFRIDRLWKAVWKGEGWRRVKGGGQGFARVHPGGYVFSRLCDVSAGGGRNQKFRDTRCRRSHVSFVATTLPPSPVQRRIAFVRRTGFTGESSRCLDTLRFTTVPAFERILSKIVYKNYSRTIYHYIP